MRRCDIATQIYSDTLKKLITTQPSKTFPPTQTALRGHSPIVQPPNPAFQPSKGRAARGIRSFLRDLCRLPRNLAYRSHKSCRSHPLHGDSTHILQCDGGRFTTGPPQPTHKICVPTARHHSPVPQMLTNQQNPLKPLKSAILARKELAFRPQLRWLVFDAGKWPSHTY